MSKAGRPTLSQSKRIDNCIASFCNEKNEWLAANSTDAATYTLDKLSAEFAKILGVEKPFSRSSFSGMLTRNDLYWDSVKKRVIPLSEHRCQKINGSYEILDSVYHTCIKTSSKQVSNSIKALLFDDVIISGDILAIIPLDKCVMIYSDNSNIKKMIKKRLALLIDTAQEP